MKRKPDILVILAALLGLGMVVSSFTGAYAAKAPTPKQVEVVANSSVPDADAN